MRGNVVVESGSGGGGGMAEIRPRGLGGTLVEGRGGEGGG